MIEDMMKERLRGLEFRRKLNGLSLDFRVYQQLYARTCLKRCSTSSRTKMNFIISNVYFFLKNLIVNHKFQTYRFTNMADEIMKVMPAS